ncbi:hypothetical protein GYMLUDRAFT_49325 [Collybiopsis luxurians FD-317 M1]|uniref:MARVEL domain-containing protein n=1 Tax=Collybiopsis luxurians FD-317 M1 TaxID=944289 RepID=A0A0D0BV26_9AGAR|nr:hypothetical protein GYMLUDRAFT_49325 [Collybiopsis luxurians FD-317 M1]
MAHLGWIRTFLYIALLVFTFILFVLCCVRINETLSVNFYDPVIAELLFTSIATMLWLVLMLCIFFIENIKFHYIRLYWQEFIGLVILWFLWIGGAAAASSIFGDLENCQHFESCRILSALLAFAWLGWIVLTVIIIISIVAMVQSTRDGRKMLDEPLPARNV